MTCPLCGRCHRYTHSTFNYKLWCLWNESRWTDDTYFFPKWKKLPNEHWADVHEAEKFERGEEEVAMMLTKVMMREGE